MTLYERYRPRAWCDVLGQEKIAKAVQRLSRGGQCFWLSGRSGQGKTTIAYIIARELADDFNIEEIDAGSLTPAKLREIEKNHAAWGLGAKSGRAFIVNEAHGLRKDTVRQLLITLERIPEHVVWIFTTTRDGNDGFLEGMQDASPLVSRCLDLRLSSQGLSRAFAVRVKEIAEREGLDGRPLKQYVELARQKRNNMRAMLRAVETGVMLP